MSIRSLLALGKPSLCFLPWLLGLKDPEIVWVFGIDVCFQRAQASSWLSIMRRFRNHRHQRLAMLIFQWHVTALSGISSSSSKPSFLLAVFWVSSCIRYKMWTLFFAQLWFIYIIFSHVASSLMCLFKYSDKHWTKVPQPIQGCTGKPEIIASNLVTKGRKCANRKPVMAHFPTITSSLCRGRSLSLHVDTSYLVMQSVLDSCKPSCKPFLLFISQVLSFSTENLDDTVNI